MKTRGRPRHPDVLTPREFEVLGLLREGLSNRQIAERLGISLDGVKYHVKEILGKLDLDSREEAALWRAETHRPWWASAVAPLALVWRKAGLAVAGGVALAAVGGLAFLAFLLLTNDDAPSLGSPQLAYFDADGAVWLADAEGVQRKLADEGSCDPKSVLGWSASGELFSCLAVRRLGDSPEGSGFLVIRDAAGAVIEQIDMPGVQNVSCCGNEPSWWSPDGAAILYSYGELDVGSTQFVQQFVQHFAVADTSDGASHDLGSTDASLTFGAANWSPDGTRIAYRDVVRGSTFIHDVETGSASELDGDYYPLAWALGGSALVVATNYQERTEQLPYRSYEANLLDLGTGALTRVPQLDNGVQFWLSADGSQAAYVTRGRRPDEPYSLSLLDLRAGEATAIDNSVITAITGPTGPGGREEPIDQSAVQFSRDGEYLYWASGAQQELYRARTDRSAPERLFDGASLASQAWSPDLQHIAYDDFKVEDDRVLRYLAIANIDGSDPVEIVSVPALEQITFAWRPAPGGTSD